MGLSGWNAHQKLKLVIDNSKVDEDLINFPINITLSSGTGQTGFDATAIFDELVIVSGTKKIAVTTTVSGIETELYIEIERWDWANEEANLWVRVPTVSSGTNTELFLYYDSDHADNTTYVGDTGDSSAQNVRDSNFKLVMHMAQDPNGDVADAIKDSTSNANHGTPGGSMTSADLVDGKIGKAIEFDGGDDQIVQKFNSNISGDAVFTLSGFLKANILNAAGTIVGAGANDTLKALALVIMTNGQTGLSFADSNNAHTAANSITTGNWYYITATKVAGAINTTTKIYLNSVDTALVSPPTTIPNITNTPITIGNFFANINGIIEEVRISNTARSAAWIKATYYSNWDAFVTFSVAVEFTFTNPIPAHLSTAYGTIKQLYLTTTISGPASEYVYDADFFDSFDVQIGTTISGIQSGQPAESNAYLSTPNGIDYSWYMTATSSGGEDTSQTYTFHNRFLASGTTEVNGILTSGIDVRLYLRDTGELLGSTVSTISGVFNIETQYNAEFYCIALSPYTDTNSLIYDFLEVD
jgi:hypothetical protein